MLSDFEKKYLTIRVGETELELMSMGDLPALKVMEMMDAKDDKLGKTIALMELASKDPQKFLNEKEFMSFNELIMIIDVWMDRSSEDATKRKKKMIKTTSVVEGGGKGVSKKDVKALTEMIDSVIEVLLSDEDALEKEIGELVEESGLDFDGLTPEESVKKVAMWFAATDNEELLIEKRLLTTGNRSGKFYPIVDGVTKRRLGFTKAEAKERFENE